MASFRGHLAFGGATAAVGTAIVGMATDATPLLLAELFGVTLLGAFLPDVDSDSGVPFFAVFGSTTLAVSGFALARTLQATDELTTHIVVPLGVFAFMWLIVGGIMKKLTRHRGIFHSIPAAAIATLLTMIIVDSLGAEPLTTALFGVAAGAGFLSHLILDEIFSIVDFRGLPFVPNRAFGSALKFASYSKAVSFATYVTLGILAYKTLPMIIAAFIAFDSFTKAL
jgi:membrane-bound metal-dependent hydrolase YbcI (DUF457 family)